MPLYYLEEAYSITPHWDLLYHVVLNHFEVIVYNGPLLCVAWPLCHICGMSKSHHTCKKKSFPFHDYNFHGTSVEGSYHNLEFGHITYSYELPLSHCTLCFGWRTIKFMPALSNKMVFGSIFVYRLLCLQKALQSNNYSWFAR